MEQTITKHHHPYKALEIKERQIEPQLMQKSPDFVMNVETRLPCLTSDFAVNVA